MRYPVTESRTHGNIGFTIYPRWIGRDESEIMMGDILLTTRVGHSSYTIGSYIAEYGMHPDEIWFILLYFFIKRDASPV